MKRRRSGACGNCLVRTALGAPAKVLGVQAQNADAFTRSFRSGSRVIGESAATFESGIVRFWFALLIAFDAVFVTLSLWTFESVMTD